MSPRAREMLDGYRRAQALPPALRARALDEIRQRAQAGELDAQAAGGAPAGTRPRWQRVRRWTGPLACVGLGGVAVWWALVRPAPIAVQRPASTAAHAAQEHARVAPPASTPEPAPPLPLAQPVADAAPSARAAAALPTQRRRTGLSPASAAARASREPPASAPAVLSAGAGRAAAGASAPAQSHAPDRTPSEPPARVPNQLPAAARDSAPAPLQPRTSSARLPAPRLETREPAATSTTLDLEVMQLRQAYDQLRSGEPQRALTALSEHARRFPGGKLGPMREVARMLALCALGKVELARTEARRFLRDHADSTYASRVRNLCDEASLTLPKID